MVIAVVLERRRSGQRKIFSGVLENGVLLDVVYSQEGGFRIAIWDGDVTYHTHWTSNGTIFVPPDLRAYQEAGVIQFPSKVGEVIDTSDLRDELASFYRKYFYADEEVTRLMAEYAMLTWVQDRFQSVPYLRFIGSWGTGKSRALELMHLTCYKSLNMGVGPAV